MRHDRQHRFGPMTDKEAAWIADVVSSVRDHGYGQVVVTVHDGAVVEVAPTIRLRNTGSSAYLAISRS